MGTGEKLMGTQTQIKGKTEQRVEAVVDYLVHSPSPVTYSDLKEVCSTSYDSLLYILATLEEMGKVRRTTLSAGPGRPKVYFEWV